MGLNNLSSKVGTYLENYLATDYMLETISFVYCLLFINTFYLGVSYKLDVSKNKCLLLRIFSKATHFVLCTATLTKVRSTNAHILLNSQNNNTTISSKLMDIQSAENCKGFSETARQIPEKEDYKF
jgi:hypothetical protein